MGWRHDKGNCLMKNARRARAEVAVIKWNVEKKVARARARVSEFLPARKRRDAIGNVISRLPDTPIGDPIAGTFVATTERS